MFRGAGLGASLLGCRSRVFINRLAKIYGMGETWTFFVKTGARGLPYSRRLCGKEGILVWLTAFFLFAPMSLVTIAATDEGVAMERASTKAPVWQVGDFWDYYYDGRSCDYNITGILPYNKINVTAHMKGVQSFKHHYEVVNVSGSTYYRVSQLIEWWENGTYFINDTNGNTSTPAVYQYYSIMTANSMNIRKSDLAIDDYNQQFYMSYNYEDTSMGGLSDYTKQGYHSFTYPDGPLAWYQFPFDSNKSWAIAQTEKDHFYETMSYKYGATVTITDLTIYTDYSQVLGSIASTCEIQSTPAGNFIDCMNISLCGHTSWTKEGTITKTNQSPEPIHDGGQDYFYEHRWYSNTAGFIVNWNSTNSTNGWRLSSYHYIPIPPNFTPIIKKINGATYLGSQTITINVDEGEKNEIEILVEDGDLKDLLNWSVLEVIPGAGLMDSLPAFEHQTTNVEINNTHANKLIIIPKQPMSLASDNHTIMVNVNDGNYDGSVNFTFQVTVINMNNKPFAAMPVPDIWLRENTTVICGNWRMTDIFKDQDQTGTIQDPLLFSAETIAGLPVDIAIDNETGIVTFSTYDYAFAGVPPAGWDATVRFTATDSGSGNAANKLSNQTNARLHIEHVNHDPGLSQIGIELQKNGLTWPEDTVDKGFDLNTAFDDPDVRYAQDMLTFIFSGQNKISVTENAGHVALTPAPDWNGKETIKFIATDRAGRVKELWLGCFVQPVPDAPFFCESEMKFLWNNTEDLKLMEASGPDGPLNHLLLSASIKDPDEIMGAVDPHTCQWWVNDSQGNALYRSEDFFPRNDYYDFNCQWTGPFSATFSPYEVKCIAKDSFGLASKYVWNVTVLNFNRLPVIQVKTPKANQTFDKDQKIQFDTWNSSDPDETRENLTFTWKSSKQGLLNQGQGLAGARFSTKDLKPGKHQINLTVADNDGGETSIIFTINIKAAPSGIPGFGYLEWIASLSVVIVLNGWKRVNAFLGSRQ